MPADPDTAPTSLLREFPCPARLFNLGKANCDILSSKTTCAWQLCLRGRVLLPWDTGFQDRVCDGDQPAGDGDNDAPVRLAAHFEMLRDRGTVGDAYDNALAECVIGLFKTEVINQIGPWKSMRDVEWEALKWVDWYNNRRLLGPIGYVPPAEAEEAFYANLNTLDMVA
jgi:putative transposase